jgi:hypothetical protein
MISIRDSDNRQIETQNQYYCPKITTYPITESPERIALIAGYNRSSFFSSSTTPIQLDATVPQGTVLQLEAFDAEIVIADSCLPQRPFTNWGCTADVVAAEGGLNIGIVSGCIDISLIP